MTKQQIFNKVWRGLKRQGFMRSVNSLDSCQYRGKYGRRCAAGWLVHSKHYKPSLEGSLVDWYGTNEPAIALMKSGIRKKQLPFVGYLQDIHDEKNQSMETALRFFAKENKLTIPKR